MKVDDAFDKFEKKIAPSASQERIARGRGERFTEMLNTIDERIEVVPSGSWAPGTSLGPMRDVDPIIVFPRTGRAVPGRPMPP
jgi:tRNA nucleotidyltransferase (CCA-adding enzyme)